uniref:DNA repair protein XRCC1 n=1 Tax=Hirondellea gigas TaxID=1518452 RepID=A0A2P2I6X7_9CRUS
MPRIKFSEVLSFSSEDPSHPADNLLNNQAFRKWKIASSDVGKQASVTLKLEKLTTLRSIDIGNDGCAFVEVLVSRDDDKYEVLLATSSFMSPVESRSQTDTSRVRMFDASKLVKTTLQQRWARIKIVCTQPFNKQLQFGLAFVTLNAPDAQETEDKSQPLLTIGGLTVREEEDEDDDQFSAGSLFAKRKSVTAAAAPLTGAAGIRAASVAAAAGDPIPGAKRKLDDTGFYQLKKKNYNSEQTASSSSSSASKTNNSTDGTQSNNKQRNKNSSDKSKIIKKLDMDRDNNSSNNKNINNNRRNVDITTPTQRRNHAGNKGTNTGDSKDASTNSSKNTTDNNIKESVAGPTASSGGSTGRRFTPFSSLFSGVVYSLSGYQNPRRSQLRDKMTAMGATYSADWTKTCTHLICAFTDTPKYKTVRGKGKIVAHPWIEDSHTFKKRMPWKRYRLDKDESSDESEEEMWAEELRPKVPSTSTSAASLPPSSSDGSSTNKVETSSEDSRTTSSEVQSTLRSSPEPNTSAADATVIGQLSASEESEGENSGCGGATDPEENTDDELERAVRNRNASSARHEAGLEHRLQGTSSDEFDADTDVDDENETPKCNNKAAVKGRVDTSSLPLPPLLSCFTGKIFFLFDNPQHAYSLRRYITAYDGQVSDYMDNSVQFVVTDKVWQTSFDEALEEHPGLKFVKTSWVWSCSDAQQLVSYRTHLVNRS